MLIGCLYFGHQMAAVSGGCFPFDHQVAVLAWNVAFCLQNHVMCFIAYKYWAPYLENVVYESRQIVYYKYAHIAHINMLLKIFFHALIFFRILSHFYVGVDVSYDTPPFNLVLCFLP